MSPLSPVTPSALAPPTSRVAGWLRQRVFKSSDRSALERDLATFANASGQVGRSDWQRGAEGILKLFGPRVTGLNDPIGEADLVHAARVFFRSALLDQGLLAAFPLSPKACLSLGFDLAIPATREPWVEEGSLPVWSSGLSVEEVLDLVQQGKGELIPGPPSFGGIEVKWRDAFHPLPGGGILLERRMVIPGLNGSGAPDQSIVWLISIPTGADWVITPESEREARVVATSTGEKAELFDGFDVMAWDEDLFLSRHRDPEADSRFVGAIASLLDAVFRAKTGAYALSLMDTRFGEIKEGADQAYTTVMSVLFRPFYRELSLIVKKAGKETAYRGQLGDQASVAEVMYRQLEAIYRLPGGGFRYEQETYARLERGFQEKCLPDAGPVIGKLMIEPDGKKRENLLREAAELCHRYYSEGGGLYEAIGRMNAHAREAGLSGYADHILLHRMGMTMAEFENASGRVMEGTREAAAQYVQMLADVKEGLGQGRTVYAWDYHYLGARLLEKLVGEEPTVTFEQAMEVCRAVFSDLGIDLDAPPYTGIVRDLSPRPNKAHVAGMAVGAAPGRAYFTLPGGPDKQYSVSEVQQIIHEMVHAVAIQTAGETESLHFMAADTFFLEHWAEGIAETIGNLIKDPLFARKYLGQFPGFTDKYFQAVEEFSSLRDTFQIRMRLLIAWMEFNLYREFDAEGRFRSLEQRLQAWRPMLLRMQGIDDNPHGISFPLMIPHLTYLEYHLYYAVYPFGQLTTDRIYRHYVGNGTPEELAGFGAAVLRLMGMGARMTSGDLEAAILAAT